MAGSPLVSGPPPLAAGLRILAAYSSEKYVSFTSAPARRYALAPWLRPHRREWLPFSPPLIKPLHRAGKVVVEKVRMPKARKPCDRFLTIDEQVRLLKSIEVEHDRLIVRIFLFCGLRPGELFALRFNDVEPRQLRIDEALHMRATATKETKTEESNGYAHLPPMLERDLAAYIEKASGKPGDFIFHTANGTPISPHNFERDVIVPAAIRAGIMPKPRKDSTQKVRRDKSTAVNFQAFRRTFATRMQKTSATVKDVQSAMRHASPDQTTKTYMKIIPASVSAAVNELETLMSQGKRRQVQ